jgi:hypothetical protein
LIVGADLRLLADRCVEAIEVGRVVLRQVGAIEARRRRALAVRRGRAEDRIEDRILEGYRVACDRGIELQDPQREVVLERAGEAIERLIFAAFGSVSS